MGFTPQSHAPFLLPSSAQVLPHIHKPTEFGLKKRMQRVREELAHHGNGEHTQLVHWEERGEAIDLWKKGLTLKSLVRLLQKYAARFPLRRCFELCLPVCYK